MQNIMLQVLNEKSALCSCCADFVFGVVFGWKCDGVLLLLLLYEATSWDSDDAVKLATPITLKSRLTQNELWVSGEWMTLSMASKHELINMLKLYDTFKH